jgi:hypothetical protein
MPPSPIDLDRFAIDVTDRAAPRLARSPSRGKLPRPRKGEAYCGPLPMSWVERAAVLPGRAWHLACALWFEASCARGKSASVRLPAKTRRRFGLADRYTFYRALRTLEVEGLVRVRTWPGQSPLITLLPATAAE